MIKTKRKSKLISFLLMLSMIFAVMPVSYAASENTAAQISEGEWSVPVRMMHASKEGTPSMGDKAIDGNAKVTIGKDSVTYAVNFKGIDMYGAYGHLLKLWSYANDDIGREKPIEATGSDKFMDADLDGGEKSEFFKTFTIVREGEKENSFFIQIQVDAMSTVGSDGTLSYFNQDAKLVFDWTKAEQLNKPQPEPDPSQKPEIAEGKWSVPVKMMHVSTDGKESMGNKAIDGNATVTVEADKVTYAVNFKEVDMSGIKGHLLKLWSYVKKDKETEILEEAFTTGKYTGSDTNGNQTEFDKTFNIVRKGAKEDVIKIAVRVDVLSSFDNQGNIVYLEQDARLVFDWANAEQLRKPQPEPEPDPSQKPEITEGKCSVPVRMMHASKEGTPSMGDKAIDGNATVTIGKDSVSYAVNFKGIDMYGMYGHLLKLWSYTKDDIGRENPIEATGSDKFMDADLDGGEKSEFFRTFTMVRDGAKEDSFFIQIQVDAMSTQAPDGSVSYFNQDAKLVFDWANATIEKEEEKPNLYVSNTDVRLLSKESYKVTAEVTNYKGYTISWSSDNEKVATVTDGEIKAIGEGSANIIVTAKKQGKPDVTATIKVTVSGEGKTAVRVDKVKADIENKKITAEINGDVLASNINPENKISESKKVISADVTTKDEGIKSAEILIKSATATALSASSKEFEIKTNAGTVKLGNEIIKNAAKENKDIKFNISEIEKPDKPVSGEYIKYYNIVLSAENKDISFGNAEARVTLPSAEGVKYAYQIKDGKRVDKKEVFHNKENNTMIFTTNHFSTWALSAKDYNDKPEGGGSSGGGGGGSIGGDFFLESGNYRVPVALWHETEDKPSMGNVAFSNNDEALVTVSLGRISKVQIATNPVTVDQFYSAIIMMKVEGKNVTTQEKGDLKTLPAEKNYKYIKRASFLMPENGQPTDPSETTYVNVEFKVPDTPMDEIVVGGLHARLKFDWSGAKKTNETSLKSDSSSARGNSSITGTEVADVDFTDKVTGIKLHTDTNRLSNECVFRVEELKEGRFFDAAKKAMQSVKESWKLYNIVTTLREKEIDPEGSVQLSIPTKDTNMKVYRINNNGTKVAITGKMKDGYYQFNTSKLGMFAIIGEIDKSAVPEKEEVKTENEKFSDIKGHWAKEDILFIVDRGLFDGTGDGKFSPDLDMTRAMFVTVLARVNGADLEKVKDSGFTDVKKDAWYAKSVAWAAENSIVNGVDDKSFNPDGKITRQDMAVILARYADKMNIRLKRTKDPKFTDLDKVGGYAKDAVKRITAAGLLNGITKSEFSPLTNSTRAQVATVIARFVKDYTKIEKPEADKTENEKTENNDAEATNNADKKTEIKK